MLFRSTLDGVLEYLICPICFWEDDGQDDPLADEFWGGPNGSSLTDARSNYIKCGAYNPEFKKQVRKPNKTDEALRVYKIVDGKLLREK